MPISYDLYICRKCEGLIYSLNVVTKIFSAIFKIDLLIDLKVEYLNRSNNTR